MNRPPDLRLPFTACLFLAAAVAPVFAQGGSADPAFSGIPFDQWFQESARSRIHWTASVADPLLSTHQRLVSRIEMKLDGKELVRRRGKGSLLIMIQLTDGKGRAWQDHYSIDLENIPEAARRNDYQFIQPFFVVPGNYAVSLALFYTATGEHAVARRKLRVPELRNDSLPGAWRDLPAVEFLAPSQPPDTWFLPLAQGRLNLPVRPRRPLQVEVFVNLTPSERLSGSNRVQNLNLAVLIPVLKVLSQVEWSDAKLNIELLDLARNRVVYRQDNVNGLDWEKAKKSLAETSPGIIDVKSLESHRYSAEFFVKEISRKIAAPAVAGQCRAVIVLSSSVTFRPEVELHPIEVAPQPGLKIFYLRYQPPRRIVFPGVPASGGGRRGNIIDEIPLPSRLGPESDDLEPLLKGLNPQLFDVTTAGQFRKALARTLAALRTM